MPIQPKEIQMRNANSNPNPKVYHLSSVNQSHGSKDLTANIFESGPMPTP